MNAALALEIGGIVLFGSIAILGIETRRPLLTVLFKPLTTAILFLVVGSPSTPFSRLIDLGIFFSLLGDVALLSESNKAFLIGLGGFLTAHLCYIAAFLGVGTLSIYVLVAAAGAIATTSIQLRRLWAGSAGLHGPVLGYAAAITAMVISAVSTIGGSLAAAPAAVIGAILFYISDSSLALNRFHRPIPHASLLTVGVYWLGQLGIGLAARGGVH